MFVNIFFSEFLASFSEAPKTADQLCQTISSPATVLRGAYAIPGGRLTVTKQLTTITREKTESKPPYRCLSTFGGGESVTGPLWIKAVTLSRLRVTPEHQVVSTNGYLQPEAVVFLMGVSDGRTSGWGECVATSLMYPSGFPGRSDMDEWALLIEQGQRLLGCDAKRLGGLVPQALRRELGAHSVIDAMEFALFDFVGKSTGAPVASLLSRPMRPTAKVYGAAHASEGKTPDLLAQRAADLYKRHGLRWIKFKAFGELEADRETLIKTRERTSPDMRFILDANLGLAMDVPQAARYINELHRVGLAVYEDPVDADWDCYAELTRLTRADIRIDERGRTEEQVIQIGRAQAADQVNIHGNWAGGFTGGMRRAELARRHGLSCSIGGSCFVGPGAAAYIHLAAAASAESCALFDSMYGKSGCLVNPYEVRDGQVRIPKKPGLGVDLDPEKVERMTETRLHLS